MHLIANRTFTQSDFDRFAQLSGDSNPIHIDPDFSAETRFGRTVAHGMLLFTVARGLLAQALPYHRLVSQSLKFPAPCFADEDFECKIHIEDEGELLAAASIAFKRISDGSTVLEGRALLGLEQAP